MSVLDDIIGGVRADLAEREARVPLAEIQRRAAAVPAPLPVLDRFTSSRLSVIAEVKRASPSKGELAEIPEPAALAARYESGGAAAISVLTEARRFKGSLEDLAQVRAAVHIPVLRKDFMVSPYQFYEARAYGADLVLLIVAALSDAELAEFYALSQELGMTPLVETHTEAELERALELGAELIGINNRNLKTLDVSLDTFAALAPVARGRACLVAESGIATSQDAANLAENGAQVLLVGETLVRHGNPANAISDMVAAAG